MRPTLSDDMLVTIETPEQAAMWVNEFGISLPTLMRVLHKAGPRLNDVREELGLARLYTFPRLNPNGQKIGALRHSEKKAT